MEESRAASNQTDLDPGSKAGKLPTGWLSRWPWATFVLPMAVFMLLGTLEPTPPARDANSGYEPESAVGDPLSSVSGLREQEEAESVLPRIAYRYYPCVYTAKILLTIVAMLLVWRGYRTFPWRVSPWAWGVGAVGVLLWIGLCQLRLEPRLLAPLGLKGLVDLGQRSAYNPLEQLGDTSGWAYLFLAIRLIGLAAVVPVIEEFFLRGFLMRFVMHDRWWQVPFGAVNPAAVVVGTAVPMLMHPGELLAALVWFSLVTWLMVRTRNIWDCVVAHAVTNLLLGVYVVVFDQWQLM